MPADTAPIVVPLDGSSNALNAVPFAAYIAKLYDDAPVHFLHVADPATVKGSEALSNAREAFNKHALELAEKYGIKNTVPQLLEGSSPADEILGYVEESGARFITIATHGRGGFQAMFIGSVADKVVRATPVPAFVIPGADSPNEAPHGPVLIALDGSPEAEHGLHLGREVAGRMDAKTYLLRAYSVPPPVGVEFSYYSPDVLSSLGQAGKEYLDTVAVGDEQKVLVQANPATAIEEVGNKYDVGLIVMTSSGKGLARRLALGSTTDRVMHSVQRPILVVPIPDNS